LLSNLELEQTHLGQDDCNHLGYDAVFIDKHTDVLEETTASSYTVYISLVYVVLGCTMNIQSKNSSEMSVNYHTYYLIRCILSSKYSPKVTLLHKTEEPSGHSICQIPC
jgi:hypothetical protein